MVGVDLGDPCVQILTRALETHVVVRTCDAGVEFVPRDFERQVRARISGESLPIGTGGRSAS